MTKPVYRQKDFKIGCFHGTLTPDKSSVEAKLRNELYLVGMLEIQIPNKESIRLRLIAYELPLKKGSPRGECIDLLGYDETLKPYVIELKDGDSVQSLDEIIRQINGYVCDFEHVRQEIEKEVQDKFLLSKFRFKAGVGKVILAPRGFYNKKKPTKEQSYEKTEIYMCSFARLRYSGHTPDIILKRCGPKGNVTLNILNWQAS